ncbi:hypothetical protein SRHO_G00061190 [Serrasalmus rhombeus]
MMVNEMQKKSPDLQSVDELMTATFSRRRQEIIGDEPLVADVINRWPALFSERQIEAEFKRIVTTSLFQSFLDGLDHLVPRLLEVYKAAVLSGKKQALKGILDCLEKDNTNERKRTAALLAFIQAHGETLDVAMKGMQVGLLIGHEGALQDAFPRDIFSVAVVVEETIVLHNLKDVTCSFAMLMGIIYCVNLEYPQAMKYSFEFLQ